MTDETFKYTEIKYVGGTPDLLPCPFCGGEGRVVFGQELHYYVGVCKNCNTHSEPRLTEEYAAESWNRRADGWIPMTERKPKDGHIVAIFKPDALENDDEYETVEWKVAYNDLEISRHLWYPLPALPEEK